VAFLAVYREGFETILFYKALLGSSGVGGLGPVVGGMAVGAVLLVGVYVGVGYFGLRLPLKPFFAVTSAVLYYMAFVFAGKGVAELQAAGLADLTPVVWAPRVPMLGVYPTVESLTLQGVLVLLAVGALAWVKLRPAPPAPAVPDARRRGPAPAAHTPPATRPRSPVSG
jgi:high-affinity iron transporter